MIERRKRRSESKSVALRIFLEELARTNQLRALALVRDDGTLVGGAGEDTEGLAAVTRGAMMGDEGTPWERATGGEDLYAQRVVLGANAMYLASVGARIRNVRKAEATLGRLLGAAA